MNKRGAYLLISDICKLFSARPIYDGDEKSVSVVSLKRGDKVLCRLDEAGRHFGMRIKEDIQEK